MKKINKLQLITLLFWSLSIGYNIQLVMAHDLQKNQVTLTKQGNQCLQLDFSLAPIDSFHQLLASALPLNAFFNEYATLPAETFNVKVQHIAALFKNNIIIIAGDGEFLTITALEMPSSTLWQQVLKEQRILHLSNASIQGHALPIHITMSACSTQRLSRVQVHVDPHLYPLLVIASAHDQFWLTQHIPSATVDF
ncbi:MAG: hypothetical protein K9K84_10150 [Methylovulum sp.]|jgi:hypothetical protein|nr:hypothetical protein [Methylovulum sp.]